MIASEASDGGSCHPYLAQSELEMNRFFLRRPGSEWGVEINIISQPETDTTRHGLIELDHQSGPLVRDVKQATLPALIAKHGFR